MKKPSFIDKFLNSITMYRLVMYGLSFIALLAIVLSIFDIIHYSFASLLFSLIILLATCYVVNFTISRILKAPLNIESSFISALILFFIMNPAQTIYDIKILFAVATIAMVSKYLIVYKAKHIFNPVALGAVVIGLLGSGNVTWWVGNKILFPFVLVLSLLIVRRIRRFGMFFSFVTVGTILMTYIQYARGFGNISELLFQNIFSWPTVFFAGIMLTEPITTPSTQKLKIIYGVVVGILFGMSFHFGVFYSSPQMALILGNLLLYFFTPKQRTFLSLIEKKEIAKNIFEFSFKPNHNVYFKAGQYFEWTLEHQGCDSRGERRYFTIASSPTEKDVKIGVKIEQNSSSFKKALVSMQVNDKLVASNLDGDFVLPADKNKKMVFIAGGIGVTPFRSMVKYMTDTNDKRQAILFYCVKSPDEIAYREIFEEAEKNIGLKVIYVVSDKESVANGWQGETGFITAEMIKKYIPDYTNYDFYMSGPNAMVMAYKKLVSGMGVKSGQIHKDYFPGF